MTPKKYLSQYRFLDAAINAKKEHCEALRKKAQSAGGNTSNGIRSSQPYDRVGDITNRVVDMEREEIARLEAEQIEIISVINAVPEQQLRTILELKYINCLSFEKIAERMQYNCRHVRRLHKKALARIKMS